MTQWGSRMCSERRRVFGRRTRASEGGKERAALATGPGHGVLGAWPPGQPVPLASEAALLGQRSYSPLPSPLLCVSSWRLPLHPSCLLPRLVARSPLLSRQEEIRAREFSAAVERHAAGRGWGFLPFPSGRSSLRENPLPPGAQRSPSPWPLCTPGATAPSRRRPQRADSAQGSCPALCRRRPAHAAALVG